MTAQKILHELKKQSDPSLIDHAKRFFKTGKGEYGYGDTFIGLRVPDIRAIAKEFKETPLSEVEKLLQNKAHEARMCALVILTLRYKKNNDAVYDLYMKQRNFVNGWDLVDISAPKISGPYLVDKDRSVLYELAASDAMWDRRIAMLSTFTFIRNNDLEDTLRLAEINLQDKEDLMHKATGWMLRELGKRDKPMLDHFLKKHLEEMPRTMLRYAIEKFTKEERGLYLSGDIK